MRREQARFLNLPFYQTGKVKKDPIGPKDVDADQVTIAGRVSGDKTTRSTAEGINEMAALLGESQRSLYDDALRFRTENTHEISSYDDFVDGIESLGGFWTGAWCGSEKCEQKAIADTKATIRVLPLDRVDPGVGDRLQRRLGGQRQHAPAGVAAELGLADAHHGGLVAAREVELVVVGVARDARSVRRGDREPAVEAVERCDDGAETRITRELLDEREPLRRRNLGRSLSQSRPRRSRTAPPRRPGRSRAAGSGD